MGSETSAEKLAPAVIDMLKREISAERFKELLDNRVWASAVVDSCICGFHSGDSVWLDAHHVLEKWPYDVTKISCPVFLYHGEHDKTILMVEAEFNEKIIPQAKLIRSDDNHLSITQHANEAIRNVLGLGSTVPRGQVP